MIKRHFHSSVKNSSEFNISEKYKNYLIDLISIIKNQAQEAKLEADGVVA